MPDRFFSPTPLNAETARLTGPEAHHLRHVLRLRAGAEVVLFDGDGVEATAEIVSVEKSSVELRILETRRDNFDSQAQIVLGTAIPKGDRFRWLVEKSAELGIGSLVPLNTTRSVVDPRESRLEKMRAVVIAACKQSRRNRLMRIEAPATWVEFVDRYRADRSDAEVRFLVAEPAGEPLSLILTQAAMQAQAAKPCSSSHAGDDIGHGTGRSGQSGADSQPCRPTVVLAVGPEGGFTPLELDQAAAAGARLVSLGSRILRVETAAIALTSVFSLATVFAEASDSRTSSRR